MKISGKQRATLQIWLIIIAMSGTIIGFEMIDHLANLADRNAQDFLEFFREGIFFGIGVPFMAGIFLTQMYKRVHDGNSHLLKLLQLKRFEEALAKSKDWDELTNHIVSLPAQLFPTVRTTLSIFVR